MGLYQTVLGKNKALFIFQLIDLSWVNTNYDKTVLLYNEIQNMLIFSPNMQYKRQSG